MQDKANHHCRDASFNFAELKHKTIQLTGRKVRVQTPRTQDCEALAKILCEDKTLRSTLSMLSTDRPTANDVFRHIKAWCKRSNSVTMAIVDNKENAVGTISLSHVNEEKGIGRVGYWLSSNHWQQGYTSEAFGLVLFLAHQLRLVELSANISENNSASLCLWRRYHATEQKLSEAKIACTLHLPLHKAARESLFDGVCKWQMGSGL